MTLSIRDDDDQIARLEQELINHCTKALERNGIAAYVDGVFSLDDLETKMEDDLNGLIGVGIGYQGSKATEVLANGAADPRTATMNEMLFMILLAVPVDKELSQRGYATKLLTVLRKGILGKSVDTARTQRPWVYVQEKPEIDESSKTMLYYTQVWRLLMPVVGK